MADLAGATDTGETEERAIAFGCGAAQLWGVYTPALSGTADGRCAVVIAVGGPQYRVGSHRQDQPVFHACTSRLGREHRPLSAIAGRGFVGDGAQALHPRGQRVQSLPGIRRRRKSAQGDRAARPTA